MIWLVIVLVVAIDLAIMALVFRALAHGTWNGMVGDHAAQPPAPDAVCRNFQSFRIGAVNLGGCVHVAADDRYLHLVPVRPMRWFGARSASIPWEHIEVVKRSRGGRSVTARIGGKTVLGPAWCLGLAEPPE